MNKTRQRKFRSSPLRNKIATEPSAPLQQPQSIFIIHHLAAPSSGPLKFNKSKYSSKCSHQSSHLSHSYVKTGIKTSPGRQTWKRSSMNHFMAVFRKNRGVTDRSMSQSRTNKGISNHQLDRLKDIMKKTGNFQSPKSEEQSSIQKISKGAPRGWLKRQQSKKDEECMIKFGRQFMVEKLEIRKTSERMPFKLQSWQGVRLLQRKGRKVSDLMKNMDVRLRRESTDKFSLTGWLVDNDLND